MEEFILKSNISLDEYKNSIVEFAVNYDSLDSTGEDNVLVNDEHHVSNGNLVEEYPYKNRVHHRQKV